MGSGGTSIALNFGWGMLPTGVSGRQMGRNPRTKGQKMYRKQDFQRGGEWDIKEKLYCIA